MPTALLCPRDNLAGILTNDGMSVSLRMPGQEQAVTLPTQGVLDRFPDSTLISVSGWANALDRLISTREQSMTLDFTLMLFDPELSNRCRESVASELASLIVSPSNVNYALDVLLAVPLPNSADLIGAKISVTNEESVARYVDLIIEAQERVIVAHRAWHSLQSHPMVRNRDSESLRGAFIRFGIFRRFVLNAKTQVDVGSLVAELVFVDTLSKQCDPRLLQAFASNYSENLPAGDSQPMDRQPKSKRAARDNKP